MKTQQVQSSGFFPLVHLERVEFGLEAPPVAKGGARCFLFALQTGEIVEQREMALRIQQRLMFVLTVQFDKKFGLLFQRRGGHQHVVDEGAAAPLRRDLAADDELGAR